jgi:hypothetical protein
MTGDELDPSGTCEHGEIRAACIDCLSKPRPHAPKPARPRRPTSSPKSADDIILPLSGDKDVSVPVHRLDPYLDARTDWLIGQGYPHDLRPGGWLYLRNDDHLRARVRARRMAWREERPWRTGESLDDPGAGPGLVFDVDPATWEAVAFPLGELADRQRQGYRYLITAADGASVRHLTAGDPLPEGEWDSAP